MIIWQVKYKQNKYSLWYEKLIEKAQLRQNLSGYSELHHIIPRSFGGLDCESNLVRLTAREHYIAHALLWKMKFDGIYGSKMAFAFNIFISKFRTEEGLKYKVNSRTYEAFKIEYSKLMSESRKGIKRDPSIIEKCAAAKRGKKWEDIYSLETIEKIKTSIQRRVLTEQAKEKIAEGLAKGCRMKKSAAWKEKMSKRMTGIKRQKFTCSHCGKQAVLSNYNRWHNKNCKSLLVSK